MNIVAFLSAIIGVTCMSLTVIYGNRIKNKWLRYLSAIIGVSLSIVVMSSVPLLFSDESIDTTAKAGEYLVILIIAILIIKSIFFRKKKTTD